MTKESFHDILPTNEVRVYSIQVINLDKVGHTLNDLPT